MEDEIWRLRREIDDVRSELQADIKDAERRGEVSLRELRVDLQGQIDNLHELVSK